MYIQTIFDVIILYVYLYHDFHIRAKRNKSGTLQKEIKNVAYRRYYYNFYL